MPYPDADGQDGRHPRPEHYRYFEYQERDNIILYVNSRDDHLERVDYLLSAFLCIIVNVRISSSIIITWSLVPLRVYVSILIYFSLIVTDIVSRLLVNSWHRYCIPRFL